MLLLCAAGRKFSHMAGDEMAIDFEVELQRHLLDEALTGLSSQSSFSSSEDDFISMEHWDDSDGATIWCGKLGERVRLAAGALLSDSSPLMWHCLKTLPLKKALWADVKEDDWTGRNDELLAKLSLASGYRAESLIGQDYTLASCTLRGPLADALRAKRACYMAIGAGSNKTLKMRTARLVLTAVLIRAEHLKTDWAEQYRMCQLICWWPSQSQRTSGAATPTLETLALEDDPQRQRDPQPSQQSSWQSSTVTAAPSQPATAAPSQPSTSKHAASQRPSQSSTAAPSQRLAQGLRLCNSDDEDSDEARSSPPAEASAPKPSAWPSTTPDDALDEWDNVLKTWDSNTVQSRLLHDFEASAPEHSAAPSKRPSPSSQFSTAAPSQRPVPSKRQVAVAKVAIPKPRAKPPVRTEKMPVAEVAIPEHDPQDQDDDVEGIPEDQDADPDVFTNPKYDDLQDQEDDPEGGMQESEEPPEDEDSDNDMRPWWRGGQKGKKPPEDEDSDAQWRESENWVKGKKRGKGKAGKAWSTRNTGKKGNGKTRGKGKAGKARSTRNTGKNSGKGKARPPAALPCPPAGPPPGQDLQDPARGLQRAGRPLWAMAKSLPKTWPTVVGKAAGLQRAKPGRHVVGHGQESPQDLEGLPQRRPWCRSPTPQRTCHRQPQVPPMAFAAPRPPAVRPPGFRCTRRGASSSGASRCSCRSL